MLREAIDSSRDRDALKWPDIAKSIPGRTGKQCRERYLNHLKPNIKQNEEWSPTEDVLLCRLYESMGSKWALMTKFLKGRSDNAIKNRYHHIRRRLDKILTMTCTPVSQESKPVNSIDVQTADTYEKISCAVESVIGAAKMTPSLATWRYDYKFSLSPPNLPSDEVSYCKRCSLVVPSPQTGHSLCEKTGWCRTCSTTPPYLSGDLLLRLHGARASWCFQSAVKEEPH